MTVTIQATLTRPVSGQVWAFASLHVGIAGSGFVPVDQLTAERPRLHDHLFEGVSR